MLIKYKNSVFTFIVDSFSYSTTRTIPDFENFFSSGFSFIFTSGSIYNRDLIIKNSKYCYLSNFIKFYSTSEGLYDIYINGKQQISNNTINISSGNVYSFNNLGLTDILMEIRLKTIMSNPKFIATVYYNYNQYTRKSIPSSQHWFSNNFHTNEFTDSIPLSFSDINPESKWIWGEEGENDVVFSIVIETII